MLSSLENNLLDTAKEWGLTPEEFDRICEILGRQPNITELGMYSVMWSEHCSYKNSIAELKKLPKAGKRVLVSAGEENAGLIDIGDGWAVAFKIESHNHPSAVEPYQGAATGVGGIMRDIFTMGARPIAALNSLRFGNPSNPRTQYLVRDVVKGIGDYGNSFGVPTVAGDIFFDDSYDENPLVNAMAVGILRHNEIARGSAKGPGNTVLIVGSSTGRDGIHGATFASDELNEKSESKRPSVQVGDPFTEKLLLEATLECVQAGLIVGIQDMGAAGITCSTTEMSARGGCGMVIDLDKVPLREKGMSPYEIMLSESQERMLVVIKPEDESKVKSIFDKWDLHCESIGKVSAEPNVIIRMDGKVEASVSAETLVLGGGAPVYIRESQEPDYLFETRQFDPNALPEPKNYNDVLLKLISSPNICSKKWVIEQYDSSVRTNTILYGTTDAAVVRIKGTNRALAMKTDCNPRYTYLNPYKGAAIAVAESARNVVCVGATPIGITNCLNFGNPYDPEIYYQFRESIRGISDACKALETPVTGGNVSFYNENPKGPIYPTPTIGMLGLIDSLDDIMTQHFKHADDIVILLGDTNGHCGGSEYLKVIHNRVAGDAPDISLDAERRLQSLCLELIRSRVINSCHDLSEGGLAVALAESCIFGGGMSGHGEKGTVNREPWTEKNGREGLGVSMSLDTSLRKDFFLFGEDQSRVIVSASPHRAAEVLSAAKKAGVPAQTIGEVVKDRFTIEDVIDLDVKELGERYYGSFPV
ncbi:MAG TPA: phosphoribosylformylglycinamidine synthase subunit PurL [Bacteroidota bacterium]|nr:phosphoribosylformylglycinamidine synthase subunit PurL [Bacteroidota bacterium]